MTTPAPPPSPLPAPLSETEDQILRQVVTGATNREIARDRGITEATVKKHLTNINAKLGTSNRTEASHRALELGLVTVSRSDGAHGPDDRADVTRRLAEELERHRRRARTSQRALVVTVALALLAGAGYAASTWGDWADEPPPPAPGPAASEAFWVPNKPLPGPRTGLALVTVAGETFAIAGDDGSGPVASTLRYPDQFAVAWTARAPKPTAVRDIGAVALRGRVVVPGGCGVDGNAVITAEVYDPAADRWSALPDLPEPLCAYGLAELGGQAFLFGGRSGPGAASSSDLVLRYGEGDAEWTVLDDRLPDQRSDLVAVANAEQNQIHVIGGRDVDGGAERSHWIFRPYAADAAHRWDTTSAPELPDGRAGHAAVIGLALSARLYVAGGGWDARPEPAVLSLDLGGQASWLPVGDVRGRTPWRGAALTLRERGELLLVGGQAGEEALAQTLSLPLVQRIFVP